MKNITTDLWSSRAADGYMGGTMHFTSHDGRLFRFLLMFEAIPQPHNAPTISNELFSLMLEWGIIDDFLCLSPVKTFFPDREGLFPILDAVWIAKQYVR